MFGSLMMFASGVLASSPSSASASGTAARRQRSGNWARMRPASEMSRSSTSTPAWPANAWMIGRQRVRRERGRLVRVRVDDLHRGATRYYSTAWRSSRPPVICSAPRTWRTPATSSRWTSTTSPARRALSRAHFSREFRRAFGESPHQYLLTRRLERAAALLRDDRPLGRRDLLLGRPAERRLVHDELHAHVRQVADRLPRASSRPPRTWRGSPPACCAPTAARNDSTFEEDRAAARALTVGRMISIANAQLWVHDQDEALAFYTEKLGWEVRSDVTMRRDGQLPLARPSAPPARRTSRSS